MMRSSLWAAKLLSRDAVQVAPAPGDQVGDGEDDANGEGEEQPDQEEEIFDLCDRSVISSRSPPCANIANIGRPLFLIHFSFYLSSSLAVTHKNIRIPPNK